MKVTIVPADGLVIVDGFAAEGINMAGVYAAIHAVQWDGTTGWLELFPDVNGYKPPNIELTSIAQFQPLIDAALLKKAQHDVVDVQPPPGPVDSQSLKQFAQSELSRTDWTQLADVGLVNAAEFAAYRAWCRTLIFTPTDPMADGFELMDAPTPIWPTEAA